ncbi:hypothetical protein, variant [Aphanomyces astaci]|nr:hypothetical protein, variant [Aphanomyces astaci]ETV88876.1 hypothetical protein, variant [Aphanomyces astaci]|eukprot:XP_009821276.1 hypothetical protein, variant [Aphanomyces astaci]
MTASNASSDGALALGSAFTYNGGTVELWMDPLGLDVKQGGEKTLHVTWQDVVGASSNSTTLHIGTCVKDSHGHRQLDTIVLEGPVSEDVGKFANAIRYIAKFHHFHKSSLPSIDDMADKAPPAQTCLVLINPVGGTGHAQRTYDHKVHAVFEAANIVVTKVLTKHEAHATDIVESLDLTEYAFVVCVGGDGLVSEVVQGLMKRPDWVQAIRFPIGIIPGGSGNGLVKSLLHINHEEYSAVNSAYAIVKGSPQPLDMATTRNASSTRYSFLSLSWAFIADVDLDSERYRFMGSARFTMAAVIKMLSLKRWRGRLTYLVPEGETSSQPQSYWDMHGNDASSAAPITSLLPATMGGDFSEKWATIDGNFSLFWSSSVSHPSWDVHLVPGATANDGFVYLVVVEGVVSVWTMTRVLLGLETGAHAALKSVRVIKTR